MAKKIQKTEGVPSRATVSFESFADEVVANLLADQFARTITFRFLVGHAQQVRESYGGFACEMEELRLDECKHYIAEKVIEELTCRSRSWTGMIRSLARRLFRRPAYLAAVWSEKPTLLEMPEKGSLVIQLVMQVKPGGDFEQVFDGIIDHLRNCMPQRYGRTEVHLTDTIEVHRRPRLECRRETSTEQPQSPQPSASSAISRILNRYMRRS